MDLNTVDGILDFAIQKEQDAADFYTTLAGKMEYEHIKTVFLGFAAEEKGHKAKLIAVKAGKELASSEKGVQDLKLGDNLVEVELNTELTFQDALIVAMKAEKAAYKLYHDLAMITNNVGLKEIFLGLAQEEAKHKLRFEIEYDEHVLTEN